MKRKLHQFKLPIHNEIEKTIDIALRTSNSLKPRMFWNRLPYSVNSKQLEGTVDKKLQQISDKEISDIAQNMINSADNAKINTITGSLNIVSENFKIVNSNGLKAENKATYISGIINAESEHSTIPVSGIGHSSSRTLAKFSAEQIGNEAKIMCIESKIQRK